MLACLCLEEIGAYSRTARVGRGRMLRLPNVNHRPWVAEIVGRCDVYGLEREFVRPLRDFRNVSRSGRSGIQHWFFLPEGVYEALEVLNSHRTRRFFFRSEGGAIRMLEREEVESWLDSRN